MKMKTTKEHTNKRNGLTFGIQTTAVDVQRVVCSFRCWSIL